jgi:hypothetical protein
VKLPHTTGCAGSSHHKTGASTNGSPGMHASSHQVSCKKAHDAFADGACERVGIGCGCLGHSSASPKAGTCRSLWSGLGPKSCHTAHAECGARRDTSKQTRPMLIMAAGRPRHASSHRMHNTDCQSACQSCLHAGSWGISQTPNVPLRAPRSTCPPAPVRTSQAAMQRCDSTPHTTDVTGPGDGQAAAAWCVPRLGL